MLLDNVAGLSGLDGSLDGSKYLNLHLLLCLDGLGTHVWQQNAVVHLYQTFVDLWLCGVDVQASAGKFSAAERFNEGLFINDTSTSGVDEDGAILHLVELGFAERLFGLLVERKVERDYVGLSEQLLLRFNICVRGVGVWVWVSVVVDDLHVKGGRSLGEGGANTSHTNDTQRLALGVVSGFQARLPLSTPSVDFSTVVLTQAREDEEHGGIGGGIVYSSRCVRNGDSLGLGSMDIDLIVSSTVVTNRLERSRERIDELSVEKTHLVHGIVVSVNGDDVGILAAGRASLEEFGSCGCIEVLLQWKSVSRIAMRVNLVNCELWQLTRISAIEPRSFLSSS